jgi:predicted ABC-class ATPase
MKAAYKRRPADFKRRIISSINTTKSDLLDEEYRYLLQIKDEELGKKYYNLRNNRINSWWTNPDQFLSVSRKISKTRTGHKLSEETKEKISVARKGRYVSHETRQKLRMSRLGKKIPKETKDKMSAAHYERWSKRG